MPPSIPAARDVAYPGTINLEVDATDLDRRIISVRETIPVAGAGRLTLLYPAWLPGSHAPRGPIEKIAGLSFTAGGKPLAWTRDAVNVYAFHLEVPDGAASVEAHFQFLSPTDTDQGRVVMTPEMLNLQWNAVALYPAGYFTRRIQINASARYPQGWGAGTALEAAGPATGGLTRYATTNFETLVDSPVFAGRYFKQYDLDPGASVPVRLNVVADKPDALDATPAVVEKHRDLIKQAYKLYGPGHYDHYDFLLALTGRLGGIGLEHRQSSEDSRSLSYFAEVASSAAERDLLPHEYTHSWNGKYRRPADLWTPDYAVPMRGSLLWVYEGQTQYWGYVLAARSGLFSKADGLDALASTAATYEYRVGRNWRPVIDTTEDPVINARKPQPWLSWQRSEDYYSEGQLIWLDVDTLIRQRSRGRHSLDDFAKAFFGATSPDDSDLVYTRDDLIAALNRIEPYDWADFFKKRIDDVAPQAPLDGLARGGWKLVYTDTPTDYFRSSETRRKVVDLTYSIGLSLATDGDVGTVQWDSPAFKAGITAGGKVIAVNGLAYEGDRLRDAVKAAKIGEPVALLVKTGDYYRTFTLDYRGGLRYPRLERIPNTPDLLSPIYSPR